MYVDERKVEPLICYRYKILRFKQEKWKGRGGGGVHEREHEDEGMENGGDGRVEARNGREGKKEREEERKVP